MREEEERMSKEKRISIDHSLVTYDYFCSKKVSINDERESDKNQALVDNGKYFSTSTSIS